MTAVLTVVCLALQAASPAADTAEYHVKRAAGFEQKRDYDGASTGEADHRHHERPDLLREDRRRR